MKTFSLETRGVARQRGSAATTVIAILVVLALIATAVWYFRQRSPTAAALPTAQMPVSPSSTAAAAPPPANVDTMTEAELLQEAGKAMREQRLVAPAGNNAFEYYLKVLAKNPANRAAQDALRETFPFAANAAEQEINAGNFDEADREIGILAKADAGNYTLTILRSKLDAQRKVVARTEEQQKQQLAQQQAAADAATAAAAQKKLADQAAAQQAAAAAQQQAAAPARKAAPAAPVAAAPAPEPKAAPVVTQPARLVKASKARYPTQALRRRQQGWVDVQFTVDSEGNVTNAHVVGTDSGRVFERAALNAVEDRKYEPATQNGQAVDSTLVQRIEFKL